MVQEYDAVCLALVALLSTLLGGNVEWQLCMVCVVIVPNLAQKRTKLN